jgi:hypothetical protein
MNSVPNSPNCKPCPDTDFGNSVQHIERITDSHPSILDTRLAFQPRSGYFGWIVSPIAKLVPGDVK